VTDSLLRKYRIYPRMARWFNPVLLAKLLNNVTVSGRFGQYADRRLIVAALDTQTPEKLFERAEKFKERLKPDGKDSVWIDWVADLGDGFDSTYAIACLLAKKKLTVNGETLPRGQALIMGGDEVYPTATADAYRNQLVQPYAWAFPDHDKKSDEGVPLLAIPGNHDWYDGLVLFLAFFCREDPKHFGSWRTCQRRSYFAVQLTETCWLWATDIQLQNDIDQPQADYFKTIASRMEPGSRIILCGAEPGWQYTKTNSKAWDNLGYVIRIAMNANCGFTIPLVLSGDTHHYSRYIADDGTQFITSGGGGAFRHPTHHLENESTVWWYDRNKKLSLATLQHNEAERSRKWAWPKRWAEWACYPSKPVSLRLLWRDLFFALYNWDFSLLMGICYWLMGIALTLRDQWDTYLIVTVIFMATIMGYTVHQEKTKRSAVIITSALHALAQAAIVIYAARFFANWNEANVVLTSEWWRIWEWLGLILVEMGTTGFLVGSTLFGLNLLITCALFRMNYNDAFSAFRMNRYNNFLRLCIHGDNVEVFVIGLENVPKRSGWVPNPNKEEGNQDEPAYIPSEPLQPHLIDKFTV
jgi:hypothetical protein